MKIILTLSVILVLACAVIYFYPSARYNQWTIGNTKEISWTKFTWANGYVGEKYFDRLAINVPAKIEGLPYNFVFQLDLGSNLTMIYERNMNSVFVSNSESKNKIVRLNVLKFWKKNKTYEDLTIQFDEWSANAKHGFVMSDYGQPLVLSKNDTTPISIGTIGSDIFKNKVLIIDYPNQRFAICDSVPKQFNTDFVSIELDEFDRVVLPMKIRGELLRIMFDTGASLFPITTLEKNTSKFSSSPNIDTMKVSSWGELHDLTGKMISDTFELAGQKFSNVKVYTNHSGIGIDHNTDGMTGNILFWDKTIVVDFKNKKFGVNRITP